MSAAIRVTCPHCLTSLKLKSREMLGRRVTCPKCKELFSAAEEDEDLFQPPPSPASEHPLPQFAPFPRRQRRSRSGGLPPAVWFVAGCALTAIVVGAFFVPWRSLGDVNLNPFADTPDTILTQEGTLLHELGDIMEAAKEAAQGGGSIQALIAKAKDLDIRAVDLYLRAVRVRPVSRERLEADNRKHKAEAEEFANRINALLLGRANDRRSSMLPPSPVDMQAAFEFQTAFHEVSTHVQAVNLALRSMMEIPPTPQTKAQKTEVEILDLCREVAVLVSRINSSAAAQSALSVIRERTEKLETLKKRLVEESADEPLQSLFAFEGLTQNARQEIGRVTEIIGKRYSLDPEFVTAISQIDPSAAIAARMNQIPAADPARGLAATRQEAKDLSAWANNLKPDAANDPQPQIAPPTIQPAPPRIPPLVDPVSNRAAAAGAAGDAADSPDAPFVPPNTGPGSFVSSCLDQFGKDHVIFTGFRYHGLSRAEMMQFLTKFQTQYLSGIPCQFTINEGAILAIKSDDTLDSIVAKIHFLPIARIDTANRRIFIDLPAPFVQAWIHPIGGIRPAGPQAGPPRRPRRGLGQVPNAPPAVPAPNAAKPNSGL